MQIQIGSGFVFVEIDSWEKHGRERYQIDILNVADPYTGYDGLRDRTPTHADVKKNLDFMIEQEGQTDLAGYTQNQLAGLTTFIHERLIKHFN